MSNAVKDYVKFNVLGFDEDIVSEEDKQIINKLSEVRNALKYAMNKKAKYVIQAYSSEAQLKIFNELKTRQGEKCRITFVNSSSKPVEIQSAFKTDLNRQNTIMLNCVFCETRRTFKMKLNTFLNDFSQNLITKVKPDKFVSSYLKNIILKFNEVNADLKVIYDKYNEIYNNKEKEVTQTYETEIARYPKIRKESKSKRYQMSSEEALEKAKCFKGLERTKTYWNSKMNDEEKETLLNWIAKNIYSIRVYGLLNGQSGNTLLNEYTDVGDVKIRPIKTNEEGKVISQDSIVAHMSFKTLDGAPIELIKKVVSTKGRNEKIFYNNRLNDKNLALFLLSEYHDKGFKAGVRNLYKEIV